MGFDKIFDEIFCSAYMGYRKPDKGFFESIQNALRPLKPEEIMFWDSDQENIDSARKQGWQGFVYENYDEFHKIMSNVELL